MENIGTASHDAPRKHIGIAVHQLKTTVAILKAHMQLMVGRLSEPHTRGEEMDLLHNR